MQKLIDNWSWQEYMTDLNETGIGGEPYPFQHMNEPEYYPCMVDTMINEKIGMVQMIHFFFYVEAAEELLDAAKSMKE